MLCCKIIYSLLFQPPMVIVHWVFDSFVLLSSMSVHVGKAIWKRMTTLCICLKRLLKVLYYDLRLSNVISLEVRSYGEGSSLLSCWYVCCWRCEPSFHLRMHLVLRYWVILWCLHSSIAKLRENWTYFWSSNFHRGVFRYCACQAPTWLLKAAGLATELEV